MSKDKRTIGDNSANINPIEDSAINFVRENIEKLIILKRYCERAFGGKNKTIRDISAMNSAAQINCILNDLKPWQKVIEAKDNGEDVHSAPIKTHKLDIVTNMRTERFGQYIIDKDILPPHLQKVQDFIDCKEAKDKAAWEVLNGKK